MGARPAPGAREHSDRGGPLSRERAGSIALGVAEALFLAGVALLPVVQFGASRRVGAEVIPADYCFGLAAAVLLVAEVVRRGRDLRGVFPVLAVAYLGAMVIATAASPDRSESLERNVIDGYCVLLGVMAFALARTASRRLRFAWAWLVGTVVTVVAALGGILLFYLGARDPADNFAIGDLGSLHTSAVPRVVGLFENANMFCSFLVVGLLFALALVGWRRPAGIILLAGIGIALAFTLSPGLGGAFLGAGLWLAASQRHVWSRRSRVVAIVVAAAGAAVFLVFTLTIGPRAHTWADAAETFARHPLVGVGPGLPVAATFYNNRFFVDAHNAWLNVAGQAGVVGLVAFAGVLGWVCLLAWRARPLGDVAEPTRAGWFAFVGAVLYGSLSLSLEQTRHVWVLVGFVAAGLTESLRERTSARVG